MRELVAVVELGSNAVRLLLARITPGVHFEVLREERVQTRLGGGRPGILPTRAVDETVEAVHRFLRRVRQEQDPRVLAVATSAVREASNRDRLLQALRTDGVRVRILSGHEEARLGAIAVRRTLPVREGVIADLGGGSLQLIRLRRGEIVSTVSLPLGVVRLTRRFLRDDPPSPRELRALRDEIRQQLRGALPAATRGEDVVGMGGTVRALARLAPKAQSAARGSRHVRRLRHSEIAAIRERLEALTLRQRRRLPRLKADRADIVLAGAVVIEEIMTFGGYRILVVCSRGVRDGLLFQATFDGDA